MGLNPLREIKQPDEIKKGLETCIGKCTGNKPHCPYHSCGDGCMDTMNRDTLAYIQRLEAQVPKWISVEDRLPDKNGKYLVYARHRLEGLEPIIRCDLWLKGQWNKCDPFKVVYWMPLPEPPKEEDG